MQMATVRASMQSPVQSLALQSTVSSVLHSVVSNLLTYSSYRLYLVVTLSVQNCSWLCDVFNQ